MESNSGEMILSNYEQYLGEYSDVKVFSDNEHTIQYLIYDGVFKDCKTIASFGLSKYLEDSCEVIMAVDEEADRSTNILSNALFYIIQNNTNLTEGSFIEGIRNIDPEFSDKYDKAAVYFTFPFCVPDGFSKVGDCKLLLAFFITKDELEFLKKNGSSKFEDYLSEKECDVFELGRL